jgi:peptidoglycan/xylan/chitin deacetylase (PgdA/CDA1 family)
MPVPVALSVGSTASSLSQWRTMGGMRSRLSTARRVIKTAAAAADTITPRTRGVTVLAYHRVGGTSQLVVDLPLPLFTDQMEELASSGRLRPIDDALSLVTGRPGRGPNPVVVTFDDGTADFVERALPVLERLGIPATLYVATDFVETGRSFPNSGGPVTWDGLRDALSTGLVTIGSHTHTHALLDRLPAPDIEDELDRSIGLIEERLGVRPEHFAYPKAVLGSAEAQAAVRRRFRSAAVAGTRANPYGRTDPYRLARSPVQVGDGMRWWRRKLDGGMTLEDTMRRVINRRRYRGATT